MATRSAQTRTTGKPSGPAPILVINRQNVLGWLLVCMLGCGLMFVSGVLVGRNTMPLRFDMEALDQKLANLKQSVLTDKIQPIDVIENLKSNKLPRAQSGDPHTLTPKYPKTDINAESIAPGKLTPHSAAAAGMDKQTAEDHKPPAGATTQRTKTNRTERPNPAQREPAAQADLTAQADPAPETKRARKKPSTQAHQNLQSPAGGQTRAHGYAIQIASLKNPEGADKVRDRFRAKGYPAYCQKAAVNGSTYHRVRIGPYPSKEKAREDYSSLKAAGVSALLLIDDSE